MLLAVDVGNTQTVIGLIDGEDLVRHWRISTVHERAADEYRLVLRGLLQDDDPPIDGAALSSVVPAATTALRPAMEELTAGPMLVVGPGIKTGISILIDNPREVGADRIVNSISAYERYGGPAVVVDFGTATTFDALNADGAYLGGAIAPGLEIAVDALIDATAALRRVDLVPPRSVIGKGTVEAIQSGSIYGYAGLVDGIVRRISAELGPETAVVATGGLAPAIVPHCQTVETIDEHLTLRGLRLLYDLNHPK